MYATINPYNNSLVQSFSLDSLPDVELSYTAFRYWRALSFAERNAQLQRVADLLNKQKEQFAALITLEMGKPIRESVYEIEKTITAFDYYLAQAEAILQPEMVESNASKSYIRYDPMGVLFSIMPWNFPFWQVFRFAVPALVSGNVTILKHAPNVPQCARAIENLFHESGIQDGVFKNYFLSNEDAARLIADKRIVGLSFTGSDATGSKLAEMAGRHIKKCVMELGGNDAFIVLADADVAAALEGAVKSRSINSGQACNGAKRFILVPEVAKEFTEKLIAAVQSLTVGNPLEAKTQIGPLARPDLAEKVNKQVAQSIADGAQAHWGAELPQTAGNFVRPVVLTDVKPGVLSFHEELFGPVWSIIAAKDEHDAVALANQSDFGLAASVWTADLTKAEQLAAELEVGNVFINDVVKSDVRLPFGGIKRSGFGRELSAYGLKEFVNIKTVYLR